MPQTQMGPWIAMLSHEAMDAVELMVLVHAVLPVYAAHLLGTVQMIPPPALRAPPAASWHMAVAIFHPHHPL
jgi:hypothetical protein